jgi:YHS domain-containing protein
VKGKYYRVEGRIQLAKFCEDPEKYLKPELLPLVLPHRISEEEAQKVMHRVEYNGYCPVSYAASLGNKFRKQYDGLVRGDAAFAVEYDGKYYFTRDERHRAEFMR